SRVSCDTLAVNIAEPFRLVLQCQALKNSSARGESHPIAQIGILEQCYQGIRHFDYIVMADQPSILPVLNHFSNALSAACDHWLGRRHGLQIYAAQCLVPAGKRKN